ncbi:MAG: SRPBCC family protein [Limnobacter sp.]|uniref:SRPBCC family protein n=1 Tax=Limnobacter sp. TaxID=2003368 RepID=UPI00391D0C23
MKFEHLVQINDPKLFGANWLSREQVWFGLVARAWKPARFVMGLESADILQSSQEGNVTTLTRRLNYGSFQIEDRIALHEHERTETHIAANPYCGESTMTIRIEEPEQGQLWLRFEYRIEDTAEQATAPSLGVDINEVRKQAYRAADIDTVKMIRELANTLPQASQDRKDH